MMLRPCIFVITGSVLVPETSAQSSFKASVYHLGLDFGETAITSAIYRHSYNNTPIISRIPGSEEYRRFMYQRAWETYRKGDHMSRYKHTSSIEFKILTGTKRYTLDVPKDPWADLPATAASDEVIVQDLIALRKKIETIVATPFQYLRASVPAHLDKSSQMKLRHLASKAGIDIAGLVYQVEAATDAYDMNRMVNWNPSEWNPFEDDDEDLNSQKRSRIHLIIDYNEKNLNMGLTSTSIKDPFLELYYANPDLGEQHGKIEDVKTAIDYFLEQSSALMSLESSSHWVRQHGSHNITEVGIIGDAPFASMLRLKQYMESHPGLKGDESKVYLDSEPSKVAARGPALYNRSESRIFQTIEGIDYPDMSH